MPLEIERKFLLAIPPIHSHPKLISAKLIHLEQAYLKVSSTEQIRIRHSLFNGESRYYHTQLVALRPGVRTINEKQISRTEYSHLLSRRDSARTVVIKDRRCFTWHDQFFELDEIQEPASRSCHILEIQIENEGQEVSLPTFLDIEREVTGESAYSNAIIALG